MVDLGGRYLFGEGVDKDDEEGYKWIIKAAEMETNWLSRDKLIAYRWELVSNGTSEWLEKS
jgi:TPR repeat protein